MNRFDDNWMMTITYHRVSATVRVAIQTRIANVYTYAEDLVKAEDGRRWVIRAGTIRAHGSPSEVGLAGRLKAKARAEALWKELTAAQAKEVVLQ